MRLVVILTLGFGVCGPSIIDAEKIVFVVPRYIRRSYPGNASPFHSHIEDGYKMGHSMRPGTKRPHFTGHHSSLTQANTEQFFPGEKYREEFDQGQFPAKNRGANHVVIPHGKGISHGVSFGKGYIPRNQFKGMNENLEFPTGNGDNPEFTEPKHHRDVKFEEEQFPGFEEQNQGSGFQEFQEEQLPGFQEQNQAPGNQDWPFVQPESRFNQETHEEQVRFEVPVGFKGQVESVASQEENLLPKSQSPEEPRAILPPEINPPGPPTMMAQESVPAPIILQDTVDMKEYVEKVQAFAKSWAPAAGLGDFQWKNPTGIQNAPNFYQGFNSWTSGLSTTPRGYQVEEESQEGPTRRSFRAIMM